MQDSYTRRLGHLRFIRRRSTAYWLLLWRHHKLASWWAHRNKKIQEARLRINLGKLSIEWW